VSLSGRHEKKPVPESSLEVSTHFDVAERNAGFDSVSQIPDLSSDRALQVERGRLERFQEVVQDEEDRLRGVQP
jgi:hypothetical protein